MKWSVTIFVMCLALILSSGAAVVAQDTEPTVLAKVDGEPILQSDVDFVMENFVLSQLGPDQKLSDEQKQQIEQNIMNQLITQKLLMQTAEDAQITIDDAMVEQQVQGATQQMPDVAPERLKEVIETNMTIQKLLQQEIIAKIEISEEEAQQYYEERKDQFKEPQQVKASHILVQVEPDATEEEKQAARQKAEELLSEVQAGKNFADVAEAESDCPSSERGGDLGYFPRGSMVKPFEDVAFALEEGETSDVVETQFGYHIIQLTGKKTEHQASFDEVAEDVNKTLQQQKQSTAINEWITELREKTNIEIMAPEADTQETEPEATPEDEQE
jgi:peptidyl-prolyl cis-trans isomerase C